MLRIRLPRFLLLNFLAHERRRKRGRGLPATYLSRRLRGSSLSNSIISVKGGVFEGGVAESEKEDVPLPKAVVARFFHHIENFGGRVFCEWIHKVAGRTWPERGAGRASIPLGAAEIDHAGGRNSLGVECREQCSGHGVRLVGLGSSEPFS